MNDRLSSPAPLLGDPLGAVVRWRQDPGSAQWLYRVLIVLASLAFLHVFPTILFVVYMGSHGFFDYAFFREGPFVLGVFYGTAELLLIISSLMMFGVVIPLWGWARHARRERLQAIAFGLVNCAVLGTILLAVLHSKGADRFDGLVFLVFGLAIATHLAVVLHEPARRALFSLLGIFTLTGLMVALAPSSMASLLALGLRVYNVGGGVEVGILRAADSRNARLIFLGPTHAYLVFDGDAEITVLERSGEWRLRLPPPRKAAAP